MDIAKFFPPGRPASGLSDDVAPRGRRPPAETSAFGRTSPAATGAVDAKRQKKVAMNTPLLICRTQRSILMTHIAKLLREQGCINPPHALLAYYDGWKGFLERQTHTPLAGIHSLSDIFRRIPETALDPARLDRLNREYGEESLWNLMYTESLLFPHTHPRLVTKSRYTHEDTLKYVHLCFDYFEDLIDSNKIDCVIDVAMVGIFRNVLDRVTEKRGIPYIYPFNALLGDSHGDRFRINTRAMERFDDVRDRYEQLLVRKEDVKEGWDYLSGFRNSQRKSIYHFFLEAQPPQERPTLFQRLNPVRWARKQKKRISKELALRKQARQDPAVGYNFQLHKGYWTTAVRRQALAWLRTIHRRLFLRLQNGPFPDPYVFMTLHMQPEATTSMFTPYHVNQAAFVENVARAVPLGWKVVVKPNKNMVGVDPIRFLQGLSRIPNVVLTGYDADTKRLIADSRAVVTLSGTSGLEAALLGKPVFLVAKRGVIWHILRDARRFATWEELHDLLRDPQASRPDDASLAAYLQAVHDTSFNLATDYIWEGPYDLNNHDYAASLKRIAEAIRDVLTARPAPARPGPTAPDQGAGSGDARGTEHGDRSHAHP